MCTGNVQGDGNRVGGWSSARHGLERRQLPHSVDWPGCPRKEPLHWAGDGAPATHKAGEAWQVLQWEKMLAEIWS